MHVIKRGEEGPPPRGGTDRPARGFHRHRGAGGRWGGRSSLGGGGSGVSSHGTGCGGMGSIPLLWGGVCVSVSWHLVRGDGTPPALGDPSHGT